MFRLIMCKLMNILFHLLFFGFIALSLVFIVLGISNVDTLLVSIAILFAICAVLIGLENKQQLQNPFRN